MAILELKNKNLRPILINNIDINNIVISDKVSFGKEGFKYFTGYKDAKKLDLHVYFFQNLVHIEETLMKLNICLSCYKMMDY